MQLENNIGLGGLGLSGEFKFEENLNSFIAPMIPVIPYTDGGIYNPYPIFIIEARDSETNDLLATTKAVAPTTTEMGCKNCHGGEWRTKGVAGLSDETAVNILKTHDRINRTDLYSSARKGQPKLCQSCHADPALKAEGNPELPNFSSAMHGWHANYMSGMKEDACALCHPAYRKGRTRCLRGVHSRLGVTCVNCHGMLEDHAISLLNGQKEKAGVMRLLKNVKPRMAENADDIQPRTPWLNEPDCLGCHEDFEKPSQNASSFNQWVSGPEELYRIRTDNVGIRCEACHGSPHALYPANNDYNKHRDNIQPLQYSGNPLPIGSNRSCQVCHMRRKSDPVHHENMMRAFRNKLN